MVYISVFIQVKPDSKIIDPIYAVVWSVITILVNVARFHTQLLTLTQGNSNNLRQIKSELLQIRSITSVEKIKKFVGEDNSPGLEIFMKLSDSENREELQQEVSDLVKTKGIHHLKINVVGGNELVLDLGDEVDYEHSELDHPKAKKEL